MYHTRTKPVLVLLVPCPQQEGTRHYHLCYRTRLCKRDERLCPIHLLDAFSACESVGCDLYSIAQLDMTAPILLETNGNFDMQSFYIQLSMIIEESQIPQLAWEPVTISGTVVQMCLMHGVFQAPSIPKEH